MAMAKLNISLPIMLGVGVFAYVLWKIASQKQTYSTGTVYANKETADFFASQDAAFK